MNKEITYLQVLCELERLAMESEYEKDVREKPSNRHLANFIGAWEELVSGHEYGPDALLNLTWTNLGQRMARCFGEQSKEDMKYAFRIIKDDFNRKIK